MTIGAEKRTPRVRNIIVISTFITVLLILGIVAYQASKTYQIALDNGRRDSARLSAIIGDHVELTFLAVDLTLRRVVERQYFNDLFGGNIPHDLLNNLSIWVDENPQIAAMLVLNSKGQAVVAAHKQAYANWIDYQDYDFSTAPFFVRMQDGGDNFFWISLLSQPAKERKDLVLVSRKITKLNGEFGGVVIAAIDPEYFVDFFHSIGAGRKAFMALALADGTILIEGSNVPTNSHLLLPQILRDFQENPLLNNIRSGSGKVGGDLKIFSYRVLRNLPVLATVILDEADFLAAWWETRLKDIGFLGIFVVFGSVLSFFAITMARQISRVEKSEAAAVLASQAKSEFLANMSHELRTPLNAIIGFSEMLHSGYFGPLNPKQKERINDINLCGSHLLQLITDILEFSKGEAGKLELNEEKINLTEIVNETLRMMNEKIRAKNIKVHLDVEQGLPRIWGDKRKIRQILLNLLSNAVKFTPEEGSVKLVLRLDNQKNMTLIVSDTGIGIAEDKIATALSVFGQVHRDQSHEGTGLGLPLCRMFAELHGGKLAIGSVLGEGTTVRITLPKDRVIFDETTQVAAADMQYTDIKTTSRANNRVKRKREKQQDNKHMDDNLRKG